MLFIPPFDLQINQNEQPFRFFIVKFVLFVEKNLLNDSPQSEQLKFARRPILVK